MGNLELFQKYIAIAQKNLSYKNDSADEVALKYFKMALDLKPSDEEVRTNYEKLDKIVNYKNYNYPFDDKNALCLAKLFVDCCNVKEFERLYTIISDDFVCISKYFGRTKKSFIDSIYFERKSWQGMTTKVGKYLNGDRQIPCIILNNHCVLFFNIDKNKIVRVFEKKIGVEIEKAKLSEWHD